MTKALTKDITVEIISEEEYNRYRALRYDNPANPNPNRLYGRIFNPLRFIRYDEMLRIFMEHPNAYGVQFFNPTAGKKWRYSVLELKERRKFGITTISASNTSHVPDYFELHFKSLNDPNPLSKAEIKITNLEGIATGHRLFIPKSMKPDFGLKGFDEKDPRSISAIWVP